MLFLLLAPAAHAADIYFAQTAQGGGTGADCADAYAYNDGTHGINVAANWAAGNTLHVCGTITGTVGTAIISAQASGSAGNPITVKFETNAIVQAGYFPGNPSTTCTPPCGGISVNGFNHIVIDGGTNGILQATANGTGLTYSHSGIGVFLNGDDVVVKSLLVQHIYDNLGSSNGATDTNGQNTADIRVNAGTANVTICGNTLKDARAGIWSDTSGGQVTQPTTCTASQASGANFFLNTISDHCWGISASGTGYLSIYANEITDWTNWFYPNAYHQDGIITFGDSGNSLTEYIFNNYLHGNIHGASPTGLIFCTYGVSNSASSCYAFNNLMIAEADTLTCCSNFYFHNKGSMTMGPHYVYNNTLFGFTTGQIYAETDSAEIYTSENNVFLEYANNGWHMDGNGTPLGNLTSDYNDYYAGRTLPFIWGALGGGHNFADWQGAGKDTHGVYADPKMDGTWHLLSGSAAIGLGTNLTASCSGPLTALCKDKPTTVGASGSSTVGNARPTGATAWDSGAYIFANGPGVGLVPTSLNFGNVVSGTTSSSQTITLTNTGNANLVMTSVALTGADAAEFAITSNTCTGTIGAGNNCTTTVTFSPNALRAFSASVTYTDNAGDSPENDPLSGTGIAGGGTNGVPSPTATVFGFN